MDKSDWNNTVFLKTVDDIKKLKSSEGSDIQVHGSNDLAQTLFKHDLVDDVPHHARYRQTFVRRGHDSSSLYANGQFSYGKRCDFRQLPASWRSQDRYYRSLRWLTHEFWLKIYPLTLGGGKRLFVDGTIPAAFKVTESK